MAKSPLHVGSDGVFIEADLDLGNFSKSLSRRRLSIGRCRFISSNTSLVVHLLFWFYAQVLSRRRLKVSR